ncbi:hypothetical protein KKH18_11470 [bacterium]|nr:hypothetical protein [bacterium]
MKSRSIVSILLISLTIPAASVWAGEENIPVMSVQQVLEQYVNAVGGEEAISKLTSRTMKGILTNDLRDRQEPLFEEYPIEAYSKLPNLRLFIEKREGGVEEAGFDGSVFWEKTPQETLTREAETNLKMAWVQNPQNALRFQDYFPNLSYGGTADLRGRTCHKLIPEELDPLYYTLYFDVNTGLLVSLGWYWELHDWKAVDGVLVPHEIVADRKGGSTTHLFTEVIHNQELDDSMFAIPDKEK